MSGLRTFLFTDIVSSVDLKGLMPGASAMERDGAYVQKILTPHRELIEDRLEELNGRVVSTAGDGHFLVFADTVGAARWAVDVQRRHTNTPITTPRGGAVQVRMSMHVGAPQPDPRDPNNFIGKAVDYAARLCDFASGGQVLVSRAAVAILENEDLEGVRFYKHGERSLKGIGSVEVHELLYDGAAPRPPRQAPSKSDDGAREWTVVPPEQQLTQWAVSPNRNAPNRNAPTSANPSGAMAAAATTRLQRVGNYELLTLLGAGGMGNVYKARHVQFGRTRAVKVIKPHLVEAGRQDVIRRFYQEIRAIGGLEHPNVVVAIDSSTPEDSTHYLVMEYVDGVGADELVSLCGPLAPADACEVARQAALGLAYIHAQGMVHRDIKPSNLIVTLPVNAPLGAGATGADAARAGGAVVKILDLGLALLVGDDQQRLTQLDQGAMGTGLYMSPEQWRSTSVDIRADIYSLGCTLHHLLAGKPPFLDSELRQELAHERETPPDLARISGATPALAALVRKMMAKDPSDRFNDPAEVAAALEPLAVGARLPVVIERARAGRLDKTRKIGSSDTNAADTRPGHRTLTPPITTRTRTGGRAWQGWIIPTAGLISLCLAAWLVMVGIARESSLRTQRATTRATAVSLAAQILADEIDLRTQRLTDQADQPALRQAMLAVDANLEDPKLWAPVQMWVNERKEAADNRLPSDSWFVTDRTGRQVARSPKAETIGESFAQRDYFHGLGTQNPPGGIELSPISKPHQSVVYVSESTGDLKVAFSVPIWNGEQIPEKRRVIGVLGMSLPLGSFKVLEMDEQNQLPAPLEAVLIDLRPDDLPEGHRRGLLLHHKQLRKFDSAENPLRAPEELLTAIEAPGDRRKRSLGPYADLLGRPGTGGYLASMEPVVIRNADQERDTRWVVLVQEPAE